jgi:hypothetical protein
MGTPPVHAARSSATDLDVVLYRHTLSGAGADRIPQKEYSKNPAWAFFIFLKKDYLGQRFRDQTLWIQGFWDQRLWEKMGMFNTRMNKFIHQGIS